MMNITAFSFINFIIKTPKKSNKYESCLSSRMRIFLISVSADTDTNIQRITNRNNLIIFI